MYVLEYYIKDNMVGDCETVGDCEVGDCEADAIVLLLVITNGLLSRTGAAREKTSIMVPLSWALGSINIMIQALRLVIGFLD